MNSVLSRSTDIELGNYNIHVAAPYGEDVYATEPMVAIRPLFQRDDEEALHTSFEEAISDRVMAIQLRLSRLSNPSLTAERVHRVRHTTNPMAYTPRVQIQHKQEQPVEMAHPSIFGTLRQRVLLGCFGLSCMFIGFDIMGLLILHAR